MSQNSLHHLIPLRTWWLSLLIAHLFLLLPQIGIRPKDVECCLIVKNEIPVLCHLVSAPVNHLSSPECLINQWAFKHFSCIHSFTHSFIQQIVIKCLRCARHCSRCGPYTSVLVCSGCYDKGLCTEWLKQQPWTSHSSGAWKSKVSQSAQVCSGENPPGCPLIVASHGGKRLKELSGVAFGRH